MFESCLRQICKKDALHFCFNPDVGQQLKIALTNKSAPFMFLIYKVFQTKEKLRLEYTTEIEGVFFTKEKSWVNVLNFRLSTWHYQEAYFEVRMPRRKLGSTYHNSTWEECQLQRMDLHIHKHYSLLVVLLFLGDGGSKNKGCNGTKVY